MRSSRFVHPATVGVSLVLLLACCPRPPAAAPVQEGPPASADEERTPKTSTPDSPSHETPTDPIVAAVAADDRSQEDRELDEQRQPVELFQFFGVKPGMKVAELVAGRGYSTEILARIVGPEGQVYGQNTPFVLDRFAQVPWTERLEKPAMKNVVRVDSELEAPFPDDVEELDAVFMILFYHDTVWFEVDRAKMNRAVFEALKPGGVYAIVDHSAREGDGVKEAKTLHRIEQTVLQKEVLDAGFVLEAEADFLRNPDDSRDWNASPSAAGDKRGKSDRFVLRFVKPIGEDASAASPVECEMPRQKACTREYRPVCAEVDTGVRCIKSPCPSTEHKTFANACSACADPKVLRFVPGECSSK